MTWRYGEIGIDVGILIMFPRNKYVLYISIQWPPHIGEYGNLHWFIYLVGVLVLLKMSLYVEKRFCMYFVFLVG
jgi:hypothetical protein